MYKQITSINTPSLCVTILTASVTKLYSPPACHMIIAEIYKTADPMLAFHPL